MGLSAHLQDKQLLSSLFGMTPQELRSEILARAQSWHEEHPAETKVIAENLSSFGLPADDENVHAVQEHIALHYYEKLVGLCKGGPTAFSRFLSDNVECAEALKEVEKVRAEGKGVLLATPHYGAVELIVPSFAKHRLPLSAVLRFTTEEFSRMANERAGLFAESGEFGKISFIEIGKPGVRAAMDMAAVVRRGEVLLSVFDEETEYSIPVDLFGKKVLGGAGLDKLVKFAGASCAVFATFMIRSNSGYTMHLHRIPENTDNPIQSMYNALQEIVRKAPEQWYFLHEEIPFAKD